MSWAYSPSYAKPLSVPQGLDHAAHALRRARDARAPGGLPPDGRARWPRRAANAAASGGSLPRRSPRWTRRSPGADAVYPKSWGPWDLMQERVEANRGARQGGAWRDIERRALERNARHRDWICDERRMGLTRRTRSTCTACPADIGAEVSPGVMERFRVDVARQANKKVYVIMALLAARRCRTSPAGSRRSAQRSSRTGHSRRDGRRPRRALPPLAARILREAIRIPADHVDRPRRARAATRCAASATTRGRGWST